MIKVKILSLLLSVTLLFFTVIPANAAESDNIFNLLDYCTPNDNGHYIAYPTPANPYIEFHNPMRIVGSFMDSLVYIEGNVPSAVYFISSGGSSLTLQLDHLSNNLYRITGTLGGYQLSNFKLKVDITSNCNIQFLSFNVTSFRYFYYSELGTVKLETYSFSPTINYNPADTINGRSWEGVDDYTNNFISANATLNDWKLYDSFEAVFFLACSDINSITVTQGDDVIPFVVSIIGDPTWIVNDFYISVQIDFKNVNKRSDDAPTIHIEASAAPGESNTFTVMSMSGGIQLNNVNPVTFWLQKLNFSVDLWLDTITNQLFDIISHLKGDTSASDSFNDQADQKNEQLQDMVGIMDSVQRPDINQLNPSLSIQNSGADIAGGIGPVLTVPMQNPIILQVLILSLTFAMIAYVLYGKR